MGTEERRTEEGEGQARLSRAESSFFFFRPSLFSPSQMIHRGGKKKASSLSSVESNISFLLERQEGNTHSHTHTRTDKHTQRKALTSGFFAAREIRSST